MYHLDLSFVEDSGHPLSHSPCVAAGLVADACGGLVTAGRRRRSHGAVTGTCGAQALEYVVNHRQIRQFDESLGDHFEGQFEGQNGAGER